MYTETEHLLETFGTELDASRERYIPCCRSIKPHQEEKME